MIHTLLSYHLVPRGPVCLTDVAEPRKKVSDDSRQTTKQYGHATLRYPKPGLVKEMAAFKRSRRARERGSELF